MTIRFTVAAPLVLVLACQLQSAAANFFRGDSDEMLTENYCQRKYGADHKYLQKCLVDVLAKMEEKKRESSDGNVKTCSAMQGLLYGAAEQIDYFRRCIAHYEAGNSTPFDQAAYIRAQHAAYEKTCAPFCDEKSEEKLCKDACFDHEMTQSGKPFSQRLYEKALTDAQKDKAAKESEARDERCISDCGDAPLDEKDACGKVCYGYKGTAPFNWPQIKVKRECDTICEDVSVVAKTQRALCDTLCPRCKLEPSCEWNWMEQKEQSWNRVEEQTMNAMKAKCEDDDCANVPVAEKTSCVDDCMKWLAKETNGIVWWKDPVWQRAAFVLSSGCIGSILVLASNLCFTTTLNVQEFLSALGFVFLLFMVIGAVKML